MLLLLLLVLLLLSQGIYASRFCAFTRLFGLFVHSLLYCFVQAVATELQQGAVTAAASVTLAAGCGKVTAHRARCCIGLHVPAKGASRMQHVVAAASASAVQTNPNPDSEQPGKTAVEMLQQAGYPLLEWCTYRFRTGHIRVSQHFYKDQTQSLQVGSPLLVQLCVTVHDAHWFCAERNTQQAA